MVMRREPRILGAVVAAPVEGARPSLSCTGCGSPVVPGEWACDGCRSAAEGDNYLHALDDSALPTGYDAALFEKLAALEPTSFWFRGRNRVVLWALDRWFSHARTFLEVGCGTGFVLAAILRSRPGLDAVGAELYPEGLRVARTRLAGVPLAQLDARELGIEQAFDVVGAFDVLEHIDRDEDALRSLFAAVRPGGGLMVTVPQHRWLWSPADEFAGHERRYTRRELTDKMRAAGFEVVWSSSFVTILLPLMAAMRFLTRRRPYSLDREFGLSRPVDRLFEGTLAFERAAMSRGVSLPVGGSLLVVARRPGVAGG
jgi:SAM-dependent methyltransferase